MNEKRREERKKEGKREEGWRRRINMLTTDLSRVSSRLCCPQL